MTGRAAPEEDEEEQHERVAPAARGDHAHTILILIGFGPRTCSTRPPEIEFRGP
jgi:hypothetical protein